MPGQQNSQEILDREFLPMRAIILQLAAGIDRIERAEGDVRGDARFEQLRHAIAELLEPTGDRAEQVQQIFSRPYDALWQTEFGMKQKIGVTR